MQYQVLRAFQFFFWFSSNEILKSIFFTLKGNRIKAETFRRSQRYFTLIGEDPSKGLKRSAVYNTVGTVSLHRYLRLCRLMLTCSFLFKVHRFKRNEISLNWNFQMQNARVRNIDSYKFIFFNHLNKCRIFTQLFDPPGFINLIDLEDVHPFSSTRRPGKLDIVEITSFRCSNNLKREKCPYRWITRTCLFSFT